MLDDNKIQDLLLQLLSDMSYVKAKLDSLDEQKIGSRIDAVEAECKEHDRIIKSLENRSNTMEQFVRNNIADSKKTQTSVIISVGLAIFSAVLSLIVNMI